MKKMNKKLKKTVILAIAFLVTSKAVAFIDLFKKPSKKDIKEATCGYPHEQSQHSVAWLEFMKRFARHILKVS